MMLAMCLERLISVVEPLWYTTTWMEENYSMYLIVVMGLLGTLPSILPLIIGTVTYHHSRKRVISSTLNQGTTELNKQPIRTRYLGHVISYQPIRDQYFLIRSVPT